MLKYIEWINIYFCIYFVQIHTEALAESYPALGSDLYAAQHSTQPPPKQSLEGRRATAIFSWPRHPRAAMAAAATDAPRQITALSPEDEEPRATAKLFGGTPQSEREREQERDREREWERERQRERERGSAGRASEVVCPVCGVFFSSQDKLRLHAYCHTGEKPFRCSQPHCIKAFVSKYKLFR